MTTYDDARSTATDLHACKMPSNCISSNEKEAGSIYPDIDCNKPVSVAVVPLPIKSVTNDNNVSVTDDNVEVGMTSIQCVECSFQECKSDGDPAVSHGCISVHDVRVVDSLASDPDNIQPSCSGTISEILDVGGDSPEEMCDHTFDTNGILDPEKVDDTVVDEDATVIDEVRLETDDGGTASEVIEDKHLADKFNQDNEDFAVSTQCPSVESVNEFSESLRSTQDGSNAAIDDDCVNEVMHCVTDRYLGEHDDGYDNVESETGSSRDSRQTLSADKADSDVNEEVSLASSDADVVMAVLDTSKSETGIAEPYNIDVAKDCTLSEFDYATAGKSEHISPLEIHKLESGDTPSSSRTVAEHVDSSQGLTKSFDTPLLNIPCTDSPATEGSVEFSILPLSSLCKDGTAQTSVLDKQEVFTIQPVENCSASFSDVSVDGSENALPSENAVGPKVLPVCQPLANTESNSTLPTDSVALNDSLVQSILCDDDDDDLKNETGPAAAPCSPHRQLGVSFSTDASGASFKVVPCPGLDTASLSSAEANLETVELDGSGGFVEISLHSSGGSDRFDQLNDAAQVNNMTGKSGGLAGFLSR
jgi:hypothetical protein